MKCAIFVFCQELANRKFESRLSYSAAICTNGRMLSVPFIAILENHSLKSHLGGLWNAVSPRQRAESHTFEKRNLCSGSVAAKHKPFSYSRNSCLIAAPLITARGTAHGQRYGTQTDIRHDPQHSGARLLAARSRYDRQGIGLRRWRYCGL